MTRPLRELDALRRVATAAAVLDAKVVAEGERGTPLTPLGTDASWSAEYPAELAALRGALDEAREAPRQAPVDNLRNLVSGWAGDSADVPPSDAVIALAEAIERSLWFVPLVNGGMQVELHCGGVDLEVEFDAEARATSVRVERSEV